MPRGVYDRSKSTVKASTPADSADVEPQDNNDDTSGDNTDVTSDTADTGGDAVTEPAGGDVLWPNDNPAACEGPLCPQHFPEGWPAADATSVGCEHGLWLRRTAD